MGVAGGVKAELADLAASPVAEQHQSGNNAAAFGSMEEAPRNLRGGSSKPLEDSTFCGSFPKNDVQLEKPRFAARNRGSQASCSMKTDVVGFTK
jgi:hypothetical protein